MAPPPGDVDRLFDGHLERRLPNGASDQIVRTVTENSRTLKFTSQGFEKE